MIPRYTRPAMARLWSRGRRYGTWLEVELAAHAAMAEENLVPRAEVEAFARAAAPLLGPDRRLAEADCDRIEAIEETTRHDVVAFLTFLEERCGAAARTVHRGLTSSDVVDTGLALLLRAGCDQLLAGLDALLATVRSRALEHRHTLCAGRSHGMHGEPITFGLKLAVFHAALQRDRERLSRARTAVATGKLSGAVGSFAHLPPAVEERAMARLGLSFEPAATQVVQRDRHAELGNAIALCGANLERLAVEIRHLQRSEVAEVEEPFGAGQKGSSAMPHKRNPVLSENVTGLARLLRGQQLALMEDVALWHERDISHSSVERTALPDATTALDFMLARMEEVMRGLTVKPARMGENLMASGGLVFSQRVLLALVGAGMERQAAYQVVQRQAMRAIAEGGDFHALLAGDPEVRSRLDAAQLDACFDPAPALAGVDAVLRRVFGSGV